MRDLSARLAWVGLVVCAGGALLRGQMLTTYFELTPQAQADAERGRLLFWLATVALLVLAGLALGRWRVPRWTLVAAVAAGPVCLVVDDLGWIPLVAAPLVVLLLLAGIAGVLVAPRRTRQAPRVDLHSDPPTA